MEIMVRKEGKGVQILGEGGHNLARVLGVEEVTLEVKDGKLYGTVTFEVSHVAGVRVGAGLAAAAEAAQASGLMAKPEPPAPKGPPKDDKGGKGKPPAPPATGDGAQGQEGGEGGK